MRLTVSDLFASAEIMFAFDKLASELARRRVRGELFVVGGSTVALAYESERRTRDVDAVFLNRYLPNLEIPRKTADLLNELFGPEAGERGERSGGPARGSDGIAGVRCRECGRILRSHSSILAGVGPKCAQRAR